MGLEDNITKTDFYSIVFSATTRQGNSLRRVCCCASADGVMLFVFLCSHRNVYVVVVPLRRARGVIGHLKSPDEMDLEEVRTTTMTFFLGRRKRPINTHNPQLRTSGKEPF